MDSLAGPLQAMPVPFGAMFPRMRYFEIDSVLADARYAVWITVPEAYDREPARRFPAIYMPDGNWNAASAANLCDLGDWDLMDAFRPTIQVCVGYVGDDARRALAMRARDLLPPNEPTPPDVEQGVKNTEAAGLLDALGAETYLHYLRNPAGDRFLAFLTEELHPLIAAQYRIDADRTGLFGHSYGGLFATFAALQPASIFRHIGASSPGILPGTSAIFQLYGDAVAHGGIADRHLYVTVATREVTDPGVYQQLVGGGTMAFVRLAGTTPLKGLSLTSRLIEAETHITVKPIALYGFLRAFYLRSA